MQCLAQALGTISWSEGKRVGWGRCWRWTTSPRKNQVWTTRRRYLWCMNVRRSLTDSRAINYPFSKSTRRKAGRDSTKLDEEKEILLCQYALLPNALSNGLSKIHRYEDTHRVFQNTSGLSAILNLKKVNQSNWKFTVSHNVYWATTYRNPLTSKMVLCCEKISLSICKYHFWLSSWCGKEEKSITRKKG